jgi:hypothetical protein
MKDKMENEIEKQCESMLSALENHLADAKPEVRESMMKFTEVCKLLSLLIMENTDKQGLRLNVPSFEGDSEPAEETNG